MDGTKVSQLMKNTLAEREEWDEAPELYFLNEDEDGELALVSWGLPEELWGLMPPPQILVQFAAHANDLLAPTSWPMPESACGLAFRWEGWACDVNKDRSVEDQIRLDDAVHNHELHLQPERQEMRGVAVADRGGQMHMAMQLRGSEPEVMGTASEEGGGTIPTALMSLWFGLSAASAEIPG